MEMDAAKLIGAGLAVIALAGVGVGIGNIFASLVTAVGRNPAAKNEVFAFFDNVKVNEENEDLRKNRLELINMLCKTFQNFMNFQLLKTNNE